MWYIVIDLEGVKHKIILTIDRHISMTTMNNFSLAGSWIRDGFSAPLVGVSRLCRLDVLLSLHLPSLLKMATNSYQVNVTGKSPDNSTTKSYRINMVTMFRFYNSAFGIYPSGNNMVWFSKTL